MGTRTFRLLNTISMTLTITVTGLSVMGAAITGFYPGMIVLCLLTLIPIASRFFIKNISNKSAEFQRNSHQVLSILNLLVILIVLWMSFVIVHDRVLQDCC